MAERPVLFRDDMVRAILGGTKDVTRRIGPTWSRVTPGDRLWVREAHAIGGLAAPTGQVAYRADADPETAGAVRWRPSIHMPRWACRLELEVVSVTEQRCRLLPPRLPDLDDAEALREGFDARDVFMRAWLSMHGAYEGPVYRVEFRRAA